jgi:hypothetical protein
MREVLVMIRSFLGQRKVLPLVLAAAIAAVGTFATTGSVAAASPKTTAEPQATSYFLAPNQARTDESLLATLAQSYPQYVKADAGTFTISLPASPPSLGGIAPQTVTGGGGGGCTFGLISGSSIYLTGCAVALLNAFGWTFSGISLALSVLAFPEGLIYGVAGILLAAGLAAVDVANYVCGSNGVDINLNATPGPIWPICFPGGWS